MPFSAKRPMSQGALTPALALLLSLASPGAQALGLGRPAVQSTLGAPLDLSLPLHLAEGESLTDACLRAEVSAGEARVPAGLLQLRIEGEPGQQRVRVRSAVRIEEPALQITLALGCPVRLTREFNAFIDPPAVNTAAASSPAAVPVPAPAPAPLAATPLPAAAPEPAPRTVAEAPVVPRPKPKPRPKAKLPAAASGPRLELDRPEILASEAPPRPASAPASEPAASTPELEAQIRQLEQTVAQLQAELQARQAAAAASAASAAPVLAVPVPAPPHVSPYRDPMTWLLTIALSLIGGAAAFFGSRWLDQRDQRARAYLRALHAAAEGATTPQPTSVSPPAQAIGMAPQIAARGASPLPDAGQHTATRPQPKPLVWPPSEASAEPSAAAQAMLATQPLPAQAAAAPTLSLSQELGIADELLDLQQQIDFLQLLGQQDAVADLLAGEPAHGSAMPCLMLMELCQQRSDAEGFGELAKQFTRRVGLQAPAWAQSLAQGRSLDACPSVIAHLQVVWSDPAAATLMLQTLLARGRGPGVSQFELPAYRDLLMLYGVARDLFEAGLRNGDVDVMLPI